jgi:uncharacterized cupin superfamily protein
MKILQPFELEYQQHRSEKTGEGYSWYQNLSEGLGAQQLFFAREKLAPGASASASHRHSNIEEVVFVMEGTLTLHWGEERYSLSQGSSVCFHPENRQSHRLVNEGESWAEYLVISPDRKQDRVMYEGE